ncbi:MULTISPECIES: MFS transporter [Pseudomonas]
MSLAIAGLLRKVMPELAPGPQEPLKNQIATLANRFFIADLLLSLAEFTAMFGAYTYLADMLVRSGAIAPAQVGWWLMGFGTVGLLGNNLASRLVDGHPVKANILFCLMLGAGAVSAVLFVGQLILFVASLVIWGVAHTALFPLGQIRVINAARNCKALAGTLNISACNSGIAAGAMLGGWTIDFSGITAAILAASVLIVLCAFATPAVERLRPAA